MTPNLGNLPIDLPKLLETRMLVQANSGAGKSWCLRRILEQTASGVQQIVLDPEGEFASLREKFDYIVCAPHDADAVANPHTAAALARALWESGTSAIVDIYDLKAHERILFMRRFCEALINAPKSIWHPTMVVIDEIHMFAPQVGSAESCGAVIDLATRGRKRGLALVGATQRLSKLHKDVAAELLNKIIGRTGLDVDVQRAADELGMARAGAQQTLRELEPGEAFVFGPALTRGVERTKIGPVQTSHPKTGARGMIAPPPASKAVLAKLAKLSGLQREAEEEVKTVANLSAELANVRRELTLAKKAQTGVPEAEVQRRVSEAIAAEREAGKRELEKVTVPLARIRDLALQALGDGFNAMTREAPQPAVPQPREATAAPAPRHREAAPGPVCDGMSGPEQRVLDAIAWMEGIGIPEPELTAVAFLAEYSPNTGAFNNTRGRLRQRGFIEYLPGSRMVLTDAGRGLANKPEAIGSNEALHQRIYGRLGGPERRVLEPLIAAYPNAMTADEVARAASYSPGTGAFNNVRGRLRTLGLIDYPQQGMMLARAVLFPKGISNG